MTGLSRNAKRKQKHYKISKKVQGTALRPRLNVFKSLKNFEAQLIDDQNNVTLLQGSTIKLKLKNGSNIEAAKTLGQDFGKKTKKLGFEEIVFDRSGYIFHGRVKSFADEVRKQGVKF